MCGLFDTPKPPPAPTNRPAPFIFAGNDKKKLKANKKGIGDLTVDLNTSGGDSSGLNIP